MAFLNCDLFSKTLEMSTTLSVILPNDVQQRPEGGFPVAYLLHGHTENHTVWFRNTNIDRYAAERGIAIVMPEVQRSFYFDMAYGLRYFSYITEELPKQCAEMFGLSARREDTFVGGLSMGGYGALKCALRRPDVYAGCCSLSGAVDIKMLAAANQQGYEGEIIGIAGNPPMVADRDDLFQLSEQVSKMQPHEQPKFMMSCGTEDMFFNDNKRLREKMSSDGLSVKFIETPGIHEWALWEKMCTAMLDFFKECASDNQTEPNKK